MSKRLEGSRGPVDVFAISPRTLDETKYWSNIVDVTRWSERYGYAGVLLFTGNDTYVDPWLAAHHVCATTRLIPLVAVNPMYMHPFAAAKMISSLAYLYRRPVYLNMVAGTALSHQLALGDSLAHDARYERLAEYVEIVQRLVRGGGVTTFSGQYYQLSKARLSPRVPQTLQPTILLAGQSPAARAVARAADGVWIQMLQPTLNEAIPAEAGGMHFGIVARPTDEDAWVTARSHFPESPDGQAMLHITMSNTDAEWKRRLVIAAEADEVAVTGFWLGPFCNFQADCPYFVGSYQRVADTLIGLARRGIHVFILDIPAFEDEFAHVEQAFQLAVR